MFMTLSALIPVPEYVWVVAGLIFLFCSMLLKKIIVAKLGN
jgi:hypothetical protein